MLMRGVNDDQAAELLDWCLERGYELRFIEQMPLDAQHGWSREEMVTADEILDRAASGVRADARCRGAAGSAPAELFLVDGGPATVGVIASVTRPFCGDCDRVRLTADGQVRNCLFAREESDLRTAMRAGASDEEIAERWRARCGPSDPATASTTRVPPARPADVRDRRLTERPGRPGSYLDVLSHEAARRQELRQGLLVVVAGEPGLAAVGRVDLRVVPEQRHRGGFGQPFAEQMAAITTRSRDSAPTAYLEKDDAGQPRGKLSGITPGFPTGETERLRGQSDTAL